MRVGMIGRTHWLLDAAQRVLEGGHEVAFICTAQQSPESRASIEDYEAFARLHGIPLHVGPRLAGLELNADVVLSVNWITVLHQPFLDRFPHGVFNAHPGDLPRYRGNACLNWAILAGEREVALTVHRMVEELDAGPVAEKVRRTVGPQDDISTLYAWLDSEIPRALAALPDRLESGSLVLTPQDPSIRPLRAFPRKAADSAIDWSRPADEIVRLVRASTRPFAGSTTQTETGSRIVVHRARIHRPDYEILAVPGQVCFSNAGNPVIAAGDGMVELVELEDDERAKAEILSSLRNRLV